MDRDQYALPLIVILAVAIILVVAFAFSGNNGFNSGTISFEYPNQWAQEQSIGNFNASSVYSSIVLTNTQNSTQPSYIIIQMQQKTEGNLNLPSTNSIVMNTTNSSVASASIDNITATQVGSVGTSVATKYTVINKGDYYYIVSYVCPRAALNETESSYNTLLSTLKIT